LFAISFKPETDDFSSVFYCRLYESRRMILDLYQGLLIFLANSSRGRNYEMNEPNSTGAQALRHRGTKNKGYEDQEFSGFRGKRKIYV
jgi:hypothetical protein